MEFNEASQNELLLISGYVSKGFKIRTQRLEGSLFLEQRGFYTLGVEKFEDLTLKIMEPLLEGKKCIEIILFGTGENIKFVPKEIQKYLTEKKIAFDIMNTGAAARTFNVLQMESRKVAAVLIAVE